MPTARFITPEYLYKHTIIDENVDSNYLNKFIDQAQDLSIQQTIGNALYVKLQNDINSNALAGYYLTLMNNYIQRATAEYALYYALPFINYHVTNKAVSKNNSDSSSASDMEELKWLRSQIKDNAEFYCERIKDYIKNNINQFPEYYGTTGENLRPTKSNYFGGIYLGKSLKNYPKNIDLRYPDEC